MEVFFAVAYLDRREWSGDTVWSSARFGFELCLRQLLQHETGDELAAHVALCFKNPSARVQADVARFLPPQLDPPTSFFIDVLSNGRHQVSTLSDPQSWYHRWESVRVELFAISEFDKLGNSMDAERAYDRMIKFVVDQPVYDCYQNCNSICAWPTRCSPSCGCCCPLFNGTNCIEAVVVALAAGYGVVEWRAEESLGIPRRVSRGARLPSVLRDELLDSGIALKRRKVSVAFRSQQARIPLLCMIR